MNRTNHFSYFVKISKGSKQTPIPPNRVNIPKGLIINANKFAMSVKEYKVLKNME